MPHAEQPLTTDKIAQDVKDRIDHKDLAGAFKALQDETQELFKNNPDKAKDWADLSSKLQENGSLPKVAAEWMKENGNKIGGNNQSIEKSELESIARNAKDPLWKGLAQESVKNFDETMKVGNGNQSDSERKSIDERERKYYADRTMMSSPEDHAKEAVDNLVKNLDKKDSNAFFRFYGEVTKRFPLETNEERQYSWNCVQDELTNRGLMSGFVKEFASIYKNNFDTNHNNIVEASELIDKKNVPNPMTSGVAHWVENNKLSFQPLDFRPKEK